MKCLAKGEAERIADEARQAEEQAEREAAEGLIHPVVGMIYNNYISLIQTKQRMKLKMPDMQQKVWKTSYLCFMDWID